MHRRRRAARVLLAAVLAGAVVTCGRDAITSPGADPTRPALATAGPPAALSITKQPPAASLDREVWAAGVQPVVVVRDAAGVLVAGAVVSGSLSSGPGALQGTLTATTKANGSATFADLGIAGAGTSTLRFTTGSLSATSSAVAV